MKITLTDEQKQTLIIQHDTTRDGRVRDRIKAVIHASNGWSPEDLAHALLIHDTTVLPGQLNSHTLVKLLFLNTC